MDAFPTWVVQTSSLALIGVLLLMRVRWAIEAPWWLISALVALMSGSEIGARNRNRTNNDKPRQPPRLDL